MFVPIVALVALSSQRMHHGRHMQRVRHVRMVDETPGIRAGFKDVQHAFETKNWDLFRSRCTSNFQNEMPNHQVMNLRQTVAQLRSSMAPLSDIKADMNIQQIKVTGNTAVVDDRYLLKGKMRGKKGTHNVRVEGSETVSLKKVHGRWMAYYVKTHDESQSVDGRVVRHMP